MRSHGAWCIALFMGAFGCRSTATEDVRAADAGAADDGPPSIVLTADREKIVLSYRLPDGTYGTAKTVGEVPNEARQQVIVTDLSLSPEARQAGRYVYIADLRRPGDDGRYPVAVQSRYAFQEQVRVQAATATTSGGAVVIYTTAWCGVCKKAKRLLRQWGVPFVEKDIEGSKKAATELAAKAQAAGIRPGGVPVIDVAGRLLQGLDEGMLAQALAEAGLKK